MNTPTFTDIKIVLGARRWFTGRTCKALTRAQIDFDTARCAFLARATARRWEALVSAGRLLHREWKKERG
ncbi:MAG: hypothetical protein ABSD47_15860 [Candidatus Methylomirabilota bacterium]